MSKTDIKGAFGNYNFEEKYYYISDQSFGLIWLYDFSRFYNAIIEPIELYTM